MIEHFAAFKSMTCLNHKFLVYLDLLGMLLLGFCLLHTICQALNSTEKSQPPGTWSKPSLFDQVPI